MKVIFILILIST